MTNWRLPEEEELDTRKPLYVRVIALIVSVALVLWLADLFFSLVL